MLCLFFYLMLLPIQESFPEQADVTLEIAPSVRPSPVIYIALHENEKVINAYLLEHRKRFVGKFLILRQAGARNIRLTFGSQKLEVDPNRIFSRLGIEEELLFSNPGLKRENPLFEKAIIRSEQLAAWILSHCNRLEKGTILIALHNNTDGYDEDGKGGVGTLSILRYKKKLDKGASFLRTIQVGKYDEDDLIYLTRPEDFVLLKRGKWNLVLEDPNVTIDPSQDDGSLSVLAHKRGIRYFNIEAQRDPDHLENQKKMLDAVRRLLPRH